MDKNKRKGHRKSAKNNRQRALNAFDTAVDDEYYIKGLRQQQDIDLDQVADERIRDLLNNEVRSEDDEDIDSDEAMGSASDISLGEPDSEGEDNWGDSVDEDELLPLSEVWDINNKLDEGESDDETTTRKVSKPETASKFESSDDDSSEDENSSSEDEDDSIPMDSDYGHSDSESELEEDTVALRKAIQSVSGRGDVDSSHRLADVGEENPFALPQTSSAEGLTLESLAPGVSTGKVLSVPAPKRVQERANREAGFELAKAEVDKWADIVAANRRAEHLEFPINRPEQLQSASPFTAPETKSRNPLEDKVAQILNESQLADETQASTFEEMAPSKLSIEELRKRRNQLRYMRDLMFREEKRAKRIKKIKSKTYRKIHKKERERMAELEEEDDDNDNDDGGLERAERDRALERATLRHKNNSKWAKRMLEQGMTRDAGTRSEIEEMLRQSDALRQKVRGEESDSEDDGVDFADGEANVEDSSNKGILGMKFMKEAAKKEREAVDRLNRDDYDSDEDENLGRKSFNPAGQQLKRDMEAMEAASDDEDRRGMSEKSKLKRNRTEKPERGDEVIELRETGGSERLPSGSSNSSSSRNTGGNANGKSSRQSGTNNDVEAETNPWLQASSAASTEGSIKLSSSKGSNKTSKVNSRNAKIVVENTLGDSLVREKDLSLQQQDLVRQAFAGDNVAMEFEAEKAAEIDEDKDQEVDETLPGWGSWSNEKPRVQKVRKIIGINEAQRRDYKKKNVIINEKINKKASKYNASAVPFPFENRQQYERSLRMPIGQEWTTKATFQRQTKPRVLVKRGSIIDPIKKPKS